MQQALAMMTVGALVAVIAPIGACISLIRMVDARRWMAGDPHRFRVETIRNAYWMLVFAAVLAAGLCVLVIGLVVGYGVVGWAPALPGGLLVLSALVAAYARWLLARERASR